MNRLNMNYRDSPPDHGGDGYVCVASVVCLIVALAVAWIWAVV